MRRRLLLLAAAVPLAVTAVAHGCSDEPPFENACQWLADPENCYAEFYADMLKGANGENPNGDCTTVTAGAPIPTEASSSQPGTPNGSFASRTMLDTCTLTGGGAVTIDPPIDLTMFPLNPYANPTTYTLTFLNIDGTTCGMATYSSPHGFSITINPPPDTGLGDLGDAGDASAPPQPTDAGAFTDAAPYIPNGTYTQVNPPGRDSFDVTCPSGEAHHFTLDQVNLVDPAAGACPRVAGLLPSASLQVFLGGTDVPGAVSFAIGYPPTDPTYASQTTYPGTGSVSTTNVVYFNCQIPAAAETCMDGVKDGRETDIDCGGPQMFSSMYCGSCPPRCADAQGCICDADCVDGESCSVSSGLRVCVATAQLDGGLHFPTCTYDADAGLPCTPTPTTSASSSGGTTTSSSGGGAGGAGGSGTGGSGGSDGG